MRFRLLIIISQGKQPGLNDSSIVCLWGIKWIVLNLSSSEVHSRIGFQSNLQNIQQVSRALYDLERERMTKMKPRVAQPSAVLIIDQLVCENASYNKNPKDQIDQSAEITSSVFDQHHPYQSLAHSLIISSAMSTLTENLPTEHVDGPIESIYKLAKSYFPKLSSNQIISSMDAKLSQAIGTCDKAVLSTTKTIRRTVQLIPSTQEVKIFVVESSQKALEKAQKFLNSAIQTLGGKVEQTKEGDEQSITRLLNILSKTIEVNSLLFKSTANQVIQYSQAPSALVADTRIWASKLYIQVSAVSIALKQLLADTTRQILRGLGATYTETKNKVKVLLTNINEPQKAYNLLTQRLIDVKNVTVKRAQEGIQIIMDRQHYYDNIRKLASSLLDVIQLLTVKADSAIQSSTSFTKDLYQKTVRNYKTQKVLLSKPLAASKA